MATDITAIGSVADAILTAADKMATAAPLSDVGFSLLAGLFTLLLVWEGMFHLLKGADVRELITKVAVMVMMGTIASALITDSIGAKKAVVGTMDAVSNRITGMDASLMNNSDRVLQPVYASIEMALAIWKAEAPEGKTNDGGGLLETIAKTAGNWYMSLWTFIPILLLKMIAMAIVFLCGGVMLGQYIVSQILMSIAIVLAPLFMPWLIWEQARFLFDGWLKFFIKAGLYKVVGVVMLVLMREMVRISNETLQTMDKEQAMLAGDLSFVGQLLLLILISLVMGFLFMKVGDIADGLISGSAKTGLSFGKGMQNDGWKAAVKGMKQVSNTASKEASTALANVRSSPKSSGASSGSRGRNTP